MEFIHEYSASYQLPEYNEKWKRESWKSTRNMQ